MEELWKSLRTSGSTLIQKGSRFQEVRDFLSKNKKLSITLKAKKKIRDDIYEGYQDVDRKEAKEFAKEHLEELSYISDKDVDWILWLIISECKLDIPEGLTFSGILEGLLYARREKIRKEKEEAIRGYLSTHDD